MKELQKGVLWRKNEKTDFKKTVAPGSPRDKTSLCFIGERREGFLAQKRGLFLLEASTVFKTFSFTPAKADCDRGPGP